LCGFHANIVKMSASVIVIILCKATMVERGSSSRGSTIPRFVAGAISIFAS
jgi:hypothetical protein